MHFHRLGKQHLRDIAQIQLNHVRDLLAKRHITITLTPEATDLLIDEGYDPVYGARSLKRVLQRQIVDPLAMKVIQAELQDGDHVVVDAAKGHLTFNVMEIINTKEPLLV